MTRLVKFHAGVAGYRVGDVVDLDLVDDPRVGAAVDRGYAERIKVADAEAEGAEVLSAPEPPSSGAVEGAEAEEAPKPRPRTRKRQSGS